MVVTLPVVLLLLDVWPLPRPWSLALVWEKLPLVLLAAAGSALTVVAQRGAGAGASFESLPLAARMAEAVVAYRVYLEKTFWPARLAVFYPHRPLPIAEVAASCVVLLVVSALAIRERRRHPWLLVGWLWYLVTLLPVIGLVKVGEQAMADRFTYLPQIGVLIMVTWTAAETVGPRALLGATAAAAVAGCVALTTRQLEGWRDSVAPFRPATAGGAGHYSAEGNPGAPLPDQGRPAQAV